jgi:Fur family ferric uptake transcriptional regulator/Fur family zinc uptake transcriptional regulator
MLRTAGLKSTSARERVLEVLDLLSVPIAHAELSKQLVELDEVTLYRTLSTLAEARLIHRVYGLDGVWRYCIQPKHPGCPGNHAHFLCSHCGNMRCLLEQPIPRIDVPAGYEVVGRQLLIHGRCLECRTSLESTG